MIKSLRFLKFLVKDFQVSKLNTKIWMENKNKLQKIWLKKIGIFC